jgi:hypothetical protein
MSDITIPSASICAGCEQRRDEHSGGSFLCPDSPAQDGNRFLFSDSTFAHANG